MLSPTILQAISSQIQKEFYSAYLYLSMSSHFEATGLPGFAHWMRVQFQEEQAHALKLLDYVHDRGSRVALSAIAAPPAEWKGPADVFAVVAEHERTITASVHALYELALAEKDYATQVMLQWFVTEQVEEEKHVAEIIDSLKRIESHDTAVLMLDHRLKGREG